MARDDIVYTARVDFEKAKKALDNAKQKFKSTSIGSKDYYKSLGKVIKRERVFDNAQKKMEKSLGKIRRQFDMSALGVMFFGMALMRVFKSISKASISTFREVVQSVDGGFTAFEMLNGQVKFLQFTLGQALEPFIAMLIPVVAKVSEWVSLNPKLSAGILIVVGAIGSLLFLFGTLKLGITSVIGTIQLLGPMFSSIFSAIAGVVSTVGLPVIAAIVAAVVALYFAWKNNFAGIRDFFETTFENVKRAFKDIWAGVKQIFSGFITFFEGVFTGDFERVWAGLVDIVKGTWKIIKAIVVTAAVSMLNVVIFVVNAITSTFFNSIKIFLGGLKKIIEQVNRIPGINIGTGGLDSAMDKLESLKKKSQIGYQSTEGLLGTEEEDEQSKKVTDVAIRNVIEIDGEILADSASRRVLEQMERNA